MKTKRLFNAIWLIFTLTTGCSVYMAANQPDKKDIHVLEGGTSRNQVIAELGAPVSSKVEEGKTCDIFSFVQGYSKDVKAGRAILHGVADVFTFGFWELAGTPIESAASGTLVQVQILYDENECVESVKVFRGQSKLKQINILEQEKPETISE